MCNVCGCHGDGHTTVNGDTLHFGQGPARAHAPGLSQSRMVEIERDVLSKNEHYAEQNRQQFDASARLALNLLSGPGAGKTTLLCRTVEMLAAEMPLAVIEGDQQTHLDAERIRSSGAAAVQINTGKGCHLDAHMVGHALERLPPQHGGLVLIENVGNLVCPTDFSLGEHYRVVVLSVTEGEDKPLKYPDIFASADVVLLNKCDLLPHVDFDLTRCLGFLQQVRPNIEVLRVSARDGTGLNDWFDWIRRRRLAQPLTSNAS